MPTLDLDFGDVGKIVPEGIWRFLVKKASYHLNKAKDGYIIDFTMEAMDMPDSSLEGTELFPRPNASLKPAARWKLQEVLGAITQDDWTADGMQLEVDDSDPNDITVPSLEGKTVLGVIIHEEYQKRATAKLDTWIADNGEVPIGEAVSVSPDSGV